MKWPWSQPEQRSAQDYTDKVVSEILGRSSGTTADVRELAATEAAVGMFERCIGSATVTPQNPLTAAVTPSFLALVGRRLASTGNFVALIEVEGGSVRFVPATSYDVVGDADPATWEYRVDLGGPSRQRTVRTEGAGVLHFRVNCDLPWRGRSALQVASATGKLSSSVEQSLTREQAFRPTRIVYSPRGADSLTDMLADVRRGGLIGENIDELDPSGSTKQPAAIGPEPDAAQIDLRTDVSRSILSAYGLSPALFEAAGDGSGQREAWRRAWASVFSPIVRGMAAELSEKLDSPGVDLELAELRASDSQGQGRALSARAGAVKLLIEAGVDKARALQLAGFDN